MAELRIDDFSGGVTENYVNGPGNRGQIVDNLLINKNRKLFTRYGSELFDADLYENPAGNVRIGNLRYFQDILFERTGQSIYFRDGIAWSHLVGPVDSNNAFGAGTTASHVAIAEWQKHLYMTIDAYSTPRKVYYNGSDWQVRTAGLPALASDPTITPDANDAKSYIYFFHYTYTYMVDTVEHIERGYVTQVASTSSADMSGVGHYNQVTGLPVIANGGTECYDTGAIKLQIFRTTDAGTVGYYVGEVTNGTTTFQDTVVDANLGVPIYTTGGVVDNETPPLAKYLVVANDIGWYLNVKEGTEEKTFRIRQSLRDNIDSCPASYYIDVDDEIKGGGNVDIYPIVFTKNKTYRLENYVDNLGRGFTRKRVVSDTVGCVSHNGIVPLVYGLFFPAIDGFYFTDGFKVQKLSDHLNETYRELVRSDAQSKRIYGRRDNVSGLIYWTVQSDSSDTECDKIFVLDPYWGLTNESSFTTWSSGADMQPTAIEFVDGELVRADARGYALTHKEELFTDPVIDIAAATPADWATKAVNYTYLSCAFNFGSEAIRKYITKLLTVCRNVTNISLQPKSVNDDSGVYKDLKEIRFRDNQTWGDDTSIWGDEELIWNYTGVIIGIRRMPRGGLRCTFKQIGYTNSDSVIARSDDYGTGTVDSVADTITLDNASTEDWPDDIVGFDVTFGDDNYVRTYEITARTADVITVADPANSLTDGSKSWLIKGSPKNERFELESYTVYYDMFGQSHTAYNTGDDAANA